MRKSLVIAPTVVVAGFVAAAALAASAGPFADPLPGPQDGVVLPVATLTPTPQPGPTGPTSVDGTRAATADAPNAPRPTAQPSHQATGSGQPGSGQQTGSGQGKRQQGQPVSNPGPNHP